MSLGRTNLKQRTGRPVDILAEGYGTYLPVGATIAWELVPAQSGSDTELIDGTPVYIGEKAIRFGTVLVPVTQGTVQTVTISGSPTGGTFSLKVTNKNRTTKATFDYNVSADNLKRGLERLPNVGEGRVDTITLAGGVYTVTFSYENGRVPQMVAQSNLTGGTSPGVATAVTQNGSVYAGMWAPYDNTQTDGRQTLTRGRVGIQPFTMKENELSVMGANLDNRHRGLVVGGLVWKQRLLLGGTNPTLSDLLAALPLLELTPNE